MTGVLRDSAGAFLRDALHPDAWLLDPSGTRRTGEVGPNGAYSLASLAAGHYTLFASAEGYRFTAMDLDLRPMQVLVQDVFLEAIPRTAVFVEAEDRTSLQSALRRLDLGATEAIVSQLTVHAATVPQEVGTVVSSSSLATFRHTKRDPESSLLGYVEWDGRAFESANLSLLLGSLVLQTVAASSAMEEVRFVLAPESALGSVVDVRLRVMDTNDDVVSQGVAVLTGVGLRAMSMLAADGTTRFRAAPGKVTVQVVASGYELRAVEFELKCCKTNELELDLRPARHIRGRIVPLHYDGLLEDTRVFLLQEDPGGSLEPIGDPGSADEAGRYEFVVGDGSYVLIARPDPEGPRLVSEPLSVAVTGGPVEDLELVVTPAATIEIANATSFERQVFLVDASGLRIWKETVAAGRSRMAFVWPGTYSLRSIRNGDTVDHGPIHAAQAASTKGVVRE